MNGIKYVAFLDILGFKAIVKSIPSNEIGQMLEREFRASLLAGLTENPVDLEDAKNAPIELLGTNPEIGFYQFSDSLLLYSKGDSLKYLEKMVRVLNIFTAKAMLQGFPLRGALVKGDIYVNPPVMVGKAIVHAVELESCQKWAGIIVDDSCEQSDNEKRLIDALLEGQLLVKDEVPFEKDVNDSQRLIINWPQFSGLYIAGRQTFVNTFTKLIGIPEDEGHEQRLNNTLKFFEQYVGSGKLPPFIDSTYLDCSVIMMSLQKVKKVVSASRKNLTE